MRFAGAAALAAGLLAGATAQAAAPAAGDEPATETILFIRHGEKSPDGYGQLSCRGLNRALALPDVIGRRYGRVDAVFAPDPSRQKQDGALSYDYVRPLATVEPTAIRLGLPVHAAIGYDQTDKLVAALGTDAFRKAVVLVAWEHHALQALVPGLIAALGGNPASVPNWAGNDFDSIWRVTVTRSGDRPTVAFAHEKQGLDGLSDRCPGG